MMLSTARNKNVTEYNRSNKKTQILSLDIMGPPLVVLIKCERLISAIYRTGLIPEGSLVFTCQKTDIRCLTPDTF